MIIEDKNFLFLKDCQIKRQDEIISGLNKIYNDIQIQRNKDAIRDIRTILEVYFEQINSVLNININYNDNLATKCDKLRQILKDNNYDENFLSKKINSLRYTSNSASHEIKLFLGCQAISCLFDLWNIIYYFKDQNFEIPNTNFDESIYINSMNKNQVDFNVIHGSEIKKENPINQYIDIDKCNVYSWISEENTQLEIPLYQRRYVWDDENISILLEDIEDTKKDDSGCEHFFGNISAKTIKNLSQNNKELKIIKIIDGQQRLTTSLILASCVRDLILEFGGNIQNEYNFLMKKSFIYFIRKPCSDENENALLKIVLEPLSKPGIISNKIKVISQDFYLKYRVAKNYIYIYNYLKEKYSNRIDELYDFLYTYLFKFQLSTISFNSDIYDDNKETKIFEDLNSKGTKLELHEQIKNLIFNYVDNSLEFGPELKTEVIFKKYDEIVKIVTEEKLNNFYISLAEYQLGETLPSSENKRYNLIKKSLKKYMVTWNILHDETQDIKLNINQFTTFINKIKNYAEAYAGLCKPKTSRFLFDELKIRPILFMFPTNMLPYLATLTYSIIDLTHYSFTQTLNLKTKTKDYIKEIYLEVLKFLVKRHIVTPQGDSTVRSTIITLFPWCINQLKQKHCLDFDLNQKLNYILNAEKEKFYLENAMFTYDEFVDNLYQPIKSNDFKKSILLLTDYYLNDSFNNDRNNEYDTSEFEHIMPQTSDEWEKEFKKNKPTANIDKWKKEYKNHLNLLGNGLILPSKINKSIKNKPFYEKKEKYLDLTSKLYNNDKMPNINIKNRSEWTFENIDKRNEELINYITQHVITKK